MLYGCRKIQMIMIVVKNDSINTGRKFQGNCDCTEVLSNKQHKGNTINENSKSFHKQFLNLS